jgi:integrase/recombinase XerD
MLELMARGGMRIGEVLKVRAGDVSDQKIFLYDQKSGKESEAVYIPKKVAERLKEYINANNLGPNKQIFPFGYSRARDIVIEAEKLVNIQLKSHNLRRHAATCASRSGTPIEIVSKVILRHANLATTQRYLGKITDVEAVRWIENLYNEYHQ